MENIVKATLKHMVVRSVHIDIDSEKFTEEDSKFEASGKSELNIPKDVNDQTFLLSSQFEIHSRNDKDAFNTRIVTDFYFELDRRIDDYDDVIRQQCLPVIQKEVTTLANKVLSNMGYPEFLSIHQ